MPQANATIALRPRMVPGRRPTQARRMASAARVLQSFDLQALMIAAQIRDRRRASEWLALQVATGELQLQAHGHRLDDRRWTMPAPGVPAAPAGRAQA